MSEYASTDDLLGGTDGDGGEDVALPSGRTVRVRGLSRFEWFLVGKSSGDDENAWEANMLAIGVVEPKLSRGQVEAWRKAPGRMNDVGTVSDRIRELTGIGEGADKSDVRPVGDES